MRYILFITILLWLYATPAFGGNIFGTIVIDRYEDRNNTNATKINATIDIKCDSKVYKGSTSIPGSYRVRVNEIGKCVLSLKFGQHEADFKIHSKAAAVRYDFILKESSNGDYSLVRD